MVSPSKLQQQQQPQQRPRTSAEASGTRNAAATSTAHVRIQKGPKPLEKKTFYLDIKNHVLATKLENKIKELGGGIELFLVKQVSIVVSDRSVQASSSDKRKWGYASGGSGGPPSLRSIEVPTPTPTPPTPYRSVEGPLSNSTNQRGQPTQRTKSRVDAMLERALTQPQQCSVDPLNNAISWGLPIWSPYELQAWLEKIAASLRDSQSLKRDNHAGKELKFKHLKEPYIKFESYRRETRPVFLELQSWPTLNFDGDPGTCPFDLKQKKEVASINKEIKENREKYFNPNISKGKDMTRRPRATAARGRKTENTGYCEICRIDYRNLSKHLQSDQHLSFVRNDKNFLSLDNLISTGASVEAFLKINRKDVSKECNLFGSRDHSLDNGILSPDEKSEKKNKSNLNDYSIEELKMMQCNGARRNLNLKLDSPHNLRTRAKHESGHLLRSKGRPWDEMEKSEKSYDKYTIKKRAKGTIWIEEADSDDEKDVENENEIDDGKSLYEKHCESETKKNANNGENVSENVSMNGDVEPDVGDCKLKESSSNKVTTRDNIIKDSFLELNMKTKLNGYERKEDKRKVNEVLQSVENNEAKEVNHMETNTESVVQGIDNDTNNERIPPHENDDTNSLKSLNLGKDDRVKYKPAKRGGRSYRGRHRLSVEERLIEDNRDYYKVEVLGNKLRSSAIPSTNNYVSPSKDPDQADKPKKDEKQSSEKPVVVRFKRVRKSELSLLSDEAESFMFGDPRREDDDSDNSDGEQSSVLPKDTESERDEAINSFVVVSSPAVNIVPKQEVTEEESQDSTTSGRARKRRRTQTEALLMDNTDYYKFETPGSRLSIARPACRYQAPLTGISEPAPEGDPSAAEEQSAEEPSAVDQVAERVYPSKPSPEVEKMHFSFEAVPKWELWYQTYQRQDEGAEYYFSENNSPKPFLLPYEIENFHEILHKSLQSSVHRKRGRGRGGHVNMGSRSPRKSPRCHASTLAIMSTIIRRREQTQPLSVIEEEKPKAASEAGVRPEKRSSEKSDVDEDIKEIVKNIDDMLSNNDMQEMDSFEVELLKDVEEEAVPLEPEPSARGGPPANLLELLEHCNESASVNAIENSSCASSECGELGVEFPTRRRKKKRKNKTGWPGSKMRRKLHIKHLGEELQRELEKQTMEESMQNDGMAEHDTPDDVESRIAPEDEEHEVEHETGKENEQVMNTTVARPRGRRPKIRPESKEQQGSSREAKLDDVLKAVPVVEASPRKKSAEAAENARAEESESAEAECKSVCGLSSISEDSEESLSNNENLCAKDANLQRDKSPRKRRKRQRKNTSSSEVTHQVEFENRRLGVGRPRKVPKEQQPGEELVVRRRGRKRKLKCVGGKVVHEATSRKNEPFLAIYERSRHMRPRRHDSVSTELPNGEVDPALAERVSPTLITSSDVDQRRSSIDFQPVVRVMKIEDQVDMDNSLLSVAVASNRRLRSSSSPRSSMQPPKKRFRHGKRQFAGQWIKNS